VDFAESLQSLIPGVTGRVIAALTRTSVPLSGRAVADLASVSPAQAARALPRLVELGIVEARPAPPAVLYTLSHDHVAAPYLQALVDLDVVFVDRLRDLVGSLDPTPVSVAIFGSFARHEARADSDIDLLVVRPDSVPEDSERWRATVERIWAYARQLSGNQVEVLEVGRRKAHDLLRTTRPLWRTVRRDAQLVHGVPLDAI
jgi:predicted nucleotidyltransferase